MKNSSSDSPTSLDCIRSWARTKAHGPSPLSSDSRRSSILPVSITRASTRPNGSLPSNTDSSNDTTNIPSGPSADVHGIALQSSTSTGNNLADNTPSGGPPPAPPPENAGQGSVVDPEKVEKGVAIRFYHIAKNIICSSWINILLIFVPVGIGAYAAKLNPTIVFIMNVLAIVPLAGLLSHATESVAKRMGDTVGALMNVTFGNAVEIIIFIALAHDEIRIVQAAILGSILANLLLILGMCFLIGGLRFREQIYNSTITQMSACLLSLSVMSLLLPTAFHASFSDTAKADIAVVQVSRGTSVILLLVYGGYLLFQLKSHAYMYQSTPQHIIDEESMPGPVAAWMDSSSSEDDSSSSSDSDGSRSSNTTAGRIRRVMRGGRRRRKSSSSKDNDQARQTRTPSYANSSSSPTSADVLTEEPLALTSTIGPRAGVIEFADDIDNETLQSRRSRTQSSIEKHGKTKKERKHRRKHRHKKKSTRTPTPQNEKVEDTPADTQTGGFNEPRRVDFAVQGEQDAQTADQSQKKPFSLRGISIRPTIPKTFSQNVFTQPPSSVFQHQLELVPVTGPIPRIRYGIRRTNSLPDRLNQISALQTGIRPTSIRPITTTPSPLTLGGEVEENVSRTTAVFLLLFSTALVSVCANFMVDSIDSVTQNTALGETFVGLILLPIVGNAAEHVTAVTVASKNKMDLAIGVAVGSSIQIALFITPFIILLGWCMQKDMSLYFTLFETVSIFVSVFVVNFLVLDGRSNYLEGALLCAAYIIIAVAAFFYPVLGDQNSLGGNQAAAKMIRSLVTH